MRRDLGGANAWSSSHRHFHSGAVAPPEAADSRTHTSQLELLVRPYLVLGVAPGRPPFPPGPASWEQTFQTSEPSVCDHPPSTHTTPGSPFLVASPQPQPESWTLEGLCPGDRRPGRGCPRGSAVNSLQSGHHCLLHTMGGETEDRKRHPYALSSWCLNPASRHQELL